MASWTHRRFATIDQALDWLNGPIVSPTNLHPAGADVDGKTLIIEDGGANRTVTFAPAKGRNWTLEEIIDAINTAHVNLAGCASALVHLANRVGARPNRRLRIAGTVNFTVRGNGTANTDLGFDGPLSPANDTVQAIVPSSEVPVFTSITDPNPVWLVVRYA